MPSIDDASVAVALGANQPSAAGSPRETLVAVRPLLEELLKAWSAQELVYRWSSLHDTAPVGGPPDQPRYCNAVMLVEGLQAPPSVAAALELLDALTGFGTAVRPRPIAGTALGAAQPRSGSAVLG